MRKKPYVEGQRFYLGGKRKQKGEFLIGPGIKLVISLVKKILGGKRRRRKMRRRYGQK